MMSALSAFVTSVAGKVVLGTAVAAASVGGLHAADVVDVSSTSESEEELVSTVEEDELEDEDEGETDEAETDEIESDADAEDDADDEADTDELEGVEESEESEFSLAMEAWSECVDAASAEHDAANEDHDASESGPPEPFDPWEACPDWPHDHQPRDNAPEASEERQGRPEHAGPPEGVSGDDSESESESESDSESDSEAETEERDGPPEGAGRPDDVPGEDADADES